MDLNLAIICFFTFVIHLVGTLAYSVRIAGVRTRRIAMSFALFNILVLASRTSNSFQGPFLAKRVEQALQHAGVHSLATDFRWLLGSAAVATVVGAFLIPTFQRLFSWAVQEFQTHRSIRRLAIRMCSSGGWPHLRGSAAIPAPSNVTSLHSRTEVSTTTLALNVLAVSLWTVGIFSSIYAGYLKPELRLTSNSLSSIVNGVATLLMFVIIDPQLSVMTDDVVEGRVSEPSFRRTIVWLVGSRLAGTLLAQLMLIPAAQVIVFVAERI